MQVPQYEIITAIVATIVVLLLAGFFIFILITYISQRKAKYLDEKQKMEASFKQELLQAQLEIQEQTMKHISQEVHDNIGQALTLAKLNLNTMSGSSPAQLEQKINDSRALLTKAIQDLRDLSRSLNPDYMSEMDLSHSVAFELDMLKKTGTIDTRLETTGDAYSLDKQHELILLRIVQETLHNIIKHAKATLVTVEMNYQPRSFQLVICDNGIGFDASRLHTGDYTGFGLGIRNMHYRAKMINTDFKLSSTINKGVTISLHLPVPGINP